MPSYFVPLFLPVNFFAFQGQKFLHLHLASRFNDFSAAIPAAVC